MKILYFDTETTGLNAAENDIVQFSAIAEIDGQVVEEIDLMIQPSRWDNISPEALATTGMTIEQMKSFMKPSDAFFKIREFFGRHIDKFNRNDKFYPAGHNVTFDLEFLQSFWKKFDDYGTGSYQNWRKIDTMVITNFAIMSGKIPNLADVKLSTLCQHFGIEITAHNSMSDIRATRQLAKKLQELLK